MIDLIDLIPISIVCLIVTTLYYHAIETQLYNLETEIYKMLLGNDFKECLVKLENFEEKH